jgi:hypothetical protein
MTQLIAAIADSGKTVIGLSDRMVSTGDMTLGFESPNRKAEVIGSHSAVLMAGTVHEPDLVRDAKDRARGRDRIRDISDAFVQEYLELRHKRVEDEVLRVRAGIRSFDEFHRKQQHLHESVVFDLNERIREHDLGLQLILIGFDDRAHIFHVFNPGEARSFDSLGYCTIGMGDRHADNVFAWYRYSSSTPRPEALYIAFEAKKKSEMAGGVGSTTDALIIDEKGIELVEDETLQELLEIYNERELGTQSRSSDDKITKLKIKTRKP